jgi:(2R)-ethylmalonyl-CoA mutase
MRAFTELWDEICRDRYGVEDERYRRFRYGVQVNSLGLTEQQPENNVYRILIEMLAVVLSKNARARAVQLPAWNEALGLPRPWDQQWSLACSRSSPTRPTCWNTATSSTARK